MNITTSENDVKERISIAYVTAVAAAAGCQIGKMDIDKESVDVIVRPISGLKSQVNLQLKATSTNPHDGDDVKFSLSIKNYNDLRDEKEVNPSYLVILYLPGGASKWLHVSPDELAIRGCGFFGNLYLLPMLQGLQSTTVRMPKTQLFNVQCMTDMLVNAPKRIGTARIGTANV